MNEFSCRDIPDRIRVVCGCQVFSLKKTWKTGHVCSDKSWTVGRFLGGTCESRSQVSRSQGLSRFFSRNLRTAFCVYLKENHLKK